MEAGIFDALLEFGAMGLFAAFLVWQHLSMQKRFDNLINRFQDQLAGIQSKSEANEDKLRERYDAVIKQYQDDKTTFRINVAGKVEEAYRKVVEVDKKIESLPFHSIQLQIESLSMAQRDMEKTVEKGMEIMKSMQEEQKIREMARKLSDKDS
tara:strand:+ start:121 stop:579 length:459 start_codon:yes stop_codon:yes gene_type:complete